MSLLTPLDQRERPCYGTRMVPGALLSAALVAASPSGQAHDLGPASVSVSSPGADITWEAPLACPGDDELRTATERYLGRPLDEQDDGVGVRATVRPHGSGFRLELEVRRAVGRPERHVIDGSDCAALSEIAAGLAAIAIDPLALGPTSGPTEAPLPRPPVPIQRPHQGSRQPLRSSRSAEPDVGGPPLAARAEPRVEALDRTLDQPLLPTLDPTHDFGPIVAVTDERPASDHRDRPRLIPGPATARALLLASAGLAIGLFPNPSPGVRGGLGVERRAFRLELDAAGWFAGRFRSGEVGGDLRAAELALHPCGVPRWRRVELRACGAIGGGWVRAQGAGVESARVLRQPFVWLAGEFGLAIVLERRVALVVDLGAAINLARPTFWTEAPESRYVMPFSTARGRLGLEIRLP